MRQKTVIEEFNYKVTFNNHELEKFKVEFAKNPAYAMKWAEGVFKLAAENEIYAKILKCFEINGVKKSVVDSLIKQFTSEVMQEIRYPTRSTSPTSNLMAQAEATVKSELIEELSRIVWEE